MKEELKKYVELLFAGTTGTEEIRQEILQNTLDKYDDLIAQGKSPEAAYRLSISGIGDISEILSEDKEAPAVTEEVPKEEEKSKLMRAVAIGFYIISVVPVIALEESSIGICLTLLLVAAATALLILAGKSKDNHAERIVKAKSESFSPKNQLHKAISSFIGILGLGIYLAVSFITGAWYITWLIFPIIGAIKGLIFAIMDLLGGKKHED